MKSEIKEDNNSKKDKVTQMRNAQKLEVEEKQNKILEECSRLADDLLSDAEKNQTVSLEEIEVLKNSTLDYKLVYFAKFPEKHSVSNKTDENGIFKIIVPESKINKKAIDALYNLYEGTRNAQKGKLKAIADENGLRIDALSYDTKTKKCPYDTDAMLVLEKALRSIDLTKLGQRDALKISQKKWEKRRFWKSDGKEITEEEYKKLNAYDQFNKTYLKKVRTETEKRLDEGKKVTVGNTNFSFLYRYNAYLTTYNKSQLNTKRKQKAEKIEDEKDSIGQLCAPNSEYEMAKITMRVSMEQHYKKGKLSKRQLILFYLLYFPLDLPEKYAKKLKSSKEYFQQKDAWLSEEKKSGKKKHKVYRYSQKDIAFLTGLTTTIVCREKKQIDLIISELEGIQTPQKSVEDKLSDVLVEIQAIKKEIEAGNLTETERSKKENRVSYLEVQKEDFLKILVMHEMSRLGMTNRNIADLYDVDVSTVSKALNK